jgi:mRNA interferase MazF
MRRGEVWWADFGDPFGSEPAYRRPVVVVQADPFNKSALQTVLVVPMTSNLDLGGAPGNVICRAKDTGLTKASVANVTQLTAADRRRLRERAGALPGRVLKQVEEGLRLVLAL